MSGSKKEIENIDKQLKNYVKTYNKNENATGKQIAILDCVEFRNRSEQKLFNECKTKALQHKQSRRRYNQNRLRVLAHFNYASTKTRER